MLGMVKGRPWCEGRSAQLYGQPGNSGREARHRGAAGQGGRELSGQHGPARLASVDRQLWLGQAGMHRPVGGMRRSEQRGALPRKAAV